MSYSVIWNTGVITIPVTDLQLVSGSRYQLLMSDFHKEIRRLEWAFDEGMAWPQILDHTIAKLDFAGADYAPFDEIINGYTVKFGPGPSRVDLIGSNNNISDVLIANGIAVVTFNSAGLQLVSVGSGLSTGQDANLTRIKDLAEADEELTATTATKRHKDSKVVLLQKDVSGGNITDTITIDE